MCWRRRVLGPFLLGFKYYFFSFKEQKRSQGAALLLGMTVFYNGALTFAARMTLWGLLHSHGNGVKFSDRALGDGRAWQQVTRDNIWYVTHLAVGKVSAAGHDWFDQKSGLRVGIQS